MHSLGLKILKLPAFSLFMRSYNYGSLIVLKNTFFPVISWIQPFFFISRASSKPINRSTAPRMRIRNFPDDIFLHFHQFLATRWRIPNYLDYINQFLVSIEASNTQKYHFIKKFYFRNPKFYQKWKFLIFLHFPPLFLPNQKEIMMETMVQTDTQHQWQGSNHQVR